MDIPNRATHEADFARRLSRLSSRHRRELVRLLGNPPDASRVPQEFWQRVQREKEEELFLLLLLLFMASSDAHGGDDMESSGQAWAAQRAGKVASDYVAHSRDAVRNKFQRVGDAKPLTQIEIETEVVKVFGPTRDAVIAVSETTTAISAGAQAPGRKAGTLSNNDLWITENDAKVCLICASLHRVTRDDWERFFPSGPPAHPMCRCFLEIAVTPEMSTT